MGAKADVDAVWAALKARTAPSRPAAAAAAPPPPAAGPTGRSTGRAAGGAGAGAGAAPEPTAGAELQYESVEDLEERLQRHLNALQDPEQRARARALQAVERLLLGPAGPAQDLLEQAAADFVGKALLKRLADPAGACREKAAALLIALVGAAPACAQPLLPYGFPVLEERFHLAGGSEPRPLVECAAYLQAHSHTKRIDIADLRERAAAKGAPAEASEEVRLLLVQLLRAFVQHADGGLGPYATDCIELLLTAAQDPFHEVMIAACGVVELLVEVLGQRLWQVSKALVAAYAPLLAHRRNKVRVAALKAVGAVMPLGAHETLLDLTSFVDPNLVSIKSFYGNELRINYMGVLASDQSAAVRKQFLHTLGTWLTTLRERLDHEARLVPYVLSGLIDPSAEIQAAALEWVGRLGEQYVADHEADLKDKLYYMPEEAHGHGWMLTGIHRAIEEGRLALPSPFAGRPSLGSRLLVQAHFKAMLHAILREFEAWKEEPKRKAARLLLVLLVYVEEYVSEHLHILLPAFCKAMGDPETSRFIVESSELVGRYVETGLAMHVLAPLAREGRELAARARAFRVLAGLARGTGFAGTMKAHAGEALALLRDAELVRTEDTQCKVAALDALRALADVAGDAICRDAATCGAAVEALLLLGSSPSGAHGARPPPPPAALADEALATLAARGGTSAGALARRHLAALLAGLDPPRSLQALLETSCLVRLAALVNAGGDAGAGTGGGVAAADATALLDKLLAAAALPTLGAQAAGEVAAAVAAAVDLGCAAGHLGGAAVRAAVGGLAGRAAAGAPRPAAALELRTVDTLLDYCASEALDVAPWFGPELLAQLLAPAAAAGSAEAARLAAVRAVASLARCTLGREVAPGLAAAGLAALQDRLADASDAVRGAALEAAAVCTRCWGAPPASTAAAAAADRGVLEGLAGALARHVPEESLDAGLAEPLQLALECLQDAAPGVLEQCVLAPPCDAGRHLREAAQRVVAA